MKFVFKSQSSIIIGKTILFLDRDGVVIEDTGYPIGIDKIKIKEKTIMKLLNFKKKHKLKICGFITNQSGVSRNYFTENQFWDTHEFILSKCNKIGLKIDFTCVNFFVENSYFRKPNNGMIETAINYYKASRDGSIFIGDRKTDELAADKSKIKYKSVFSLD